MVVEEMDNEITLTLPFGMELETLDLGRNLSALYGEGVQAGETADPVAYEQFLADVWIGIVLTLMVLSCVCCMCSCLLYHKFQQWKRSGKLLQIELFLGCFYSEVQYEMLLGLLN